MWGSSLWRSVDALKDLCPAGVGGWSPVSPADPGWVVHGRRHHLGRRGTWRPLSFPIRQPQHGGATRCLVKSFKSLRLTCGWWRGQRWNRPCPPRCTWFLFCPCGGGGGDGRRWRCSSAPLGLPLLWPVLLLTRGRGRLSSTHTTATSGQLSYLVFLHTLGPRPLSHLYFSHRQRTPKPLLLLEGRWWHGDWSH